MAMIFVPEHNNVIALRYAEDASSVHIKVSDLVINASDVILITPTKRSFNARYVGQFQLKCNP